MHAIKHITYTHQTPALNSSLEGAEEGPYNTIKDLIGITKKIIYPFLPIRINDKIIFATIIAPAASLSG